MDNIKCLVEKIKQGFNYQNMKYLGDIIKELPDNLQTLELDL